MIFNCPCCDNGKLELFFKPDVIEFNKTRKIRICDKCHFAYDEETDELLNSNGMMLKEAATGEEVFRFPAQYLTKFFEGEIGYDEAVSCTIKAMNKQIGELIKKRLKQEGKL